MASKIIGIDLGTTNSVVAVVEGGEPIVIANPEGARTTPSVVAFSDKGERLVGQVAKRQAITNPANTIYSIKRFMGRKFDEVQDELKLVPYEVIEGLGGEVRVKVRTQEFAPPEISAMILQKLKTAAEDYLGGPVAEAVITVPAYFNDSQRQATKEAGKIAGLEVRRIINEPTAAALAYGFQKEKTGEELIAVYDLGGGTFDISILERSEGLLEVRSTSGDTHLGGDDLDRVLAGWILDEFKKEVGIDLALDKMALQRVREAAEKAKIELSTIVESTLNLPFITADASGPKHLSMTLTRAKLESLCEDLFLRTREPCLQALRDAGVKPDQIAQVLLVGGSTRIPRVQEIVRELFGREPSKNVNPDEVVAVGAAIQGAVMSGEVRDLLLLDVTPLTLGIETHGGVMTPLIQRNTTIPTKKSRTFSTVVDNQESVEIHVLQGERKMSADNKSLGKFQLVELPKAPRGVPQVEVTFDIDANGIVNVSATDRATGKQQQITVTGAAGLSEGEIERMVHDAEEHVRRDESLAELAKVRNQAESLIYSVERMLREHRKTVPPQIVSRCEEALLAMNGLLDNESAETIRSGLDALGSALNALHTAVATADAQRQAAEAAATAPPGAEGGGASNADQDGATKTEAAAGEPPSNGGEASAPGAEGANENQPPSGAGPANAETDGTANRDGNA